MSHTSHTITYTHQSRCHIHTRHAVTYTHQSHYHIHTPVTLSHTHTSHAITYTHQSRYHIHTPVTLCHILLSCSYKWWDSSLLQFKPSLPSSQHTPFCCLSLSPFPCSSNAVCWKVPQCTVRCGTGLNVQKVTVNSLPDTFWRAAWSGYVGEFVHTGVL